MSVIKMKRLTVITPTDAAGGLLRRLMKLGAVSLERLPEASVKAYSLGTAANSEALSAAAAETARIEAVLAILTKRSRRKRGLFAPVTPVDPVEFTRCGAERRALKTVQETERITESIAALKAEIAEGEALMQALMPYLTFPYSLSDPGTVTTTIRLGSFPRGIDRERLAALGKEQGFVTEILYEDKSSIYASVLFHRDTEEQVLKALSGLGFLRAVFAKTDGLPTAVFDRAQASVTAAKEMLFRLEGSLSNLADNLTEVEVLFDLQKSKHLAEEHKKQLATTAKCAILSGWCPVTCEEKVTRLLERLDAAFSFADPAPDDEPPVLLKNNGFARSFEWVVGMYSYPKYGKFDPTLIMSLFYFLIFGLMFADAGYGLVLALACFGIVRYCSPREGMKRFLLMFGFCGISCIIFGVLFGSYFGNFPLAFMENVLGIAPESLPRLSLLPANGANLAVLFDPLQNPMGFLLVSLGVGALHLIAGMAVNAVLLCRDGKPLDALFDVVFYWVLFAGIAFLFIDQRVGIPLTICGALLIIATQGRRKKGVVGKLIGGLGGIYGLVNYASDLLSYSRILALGLAAGVIGQVVNILATLKGASFLGFLLMIVVFTVGHLLNLVINVLGTFVHTSRLQYIEFFGKFYEDGGMPFQPIKLSDKYSEDVSVEQETPTSST